MSNLYKNLLKIWKTSKQGRHFAAIHSTTLLEILRSVIWAAEEMPSKS